VDLKVGQRQTL